MKLSFLIVLVILLLKTSHAQEFSMHLAYENCYSKQLDKAIQTYNFSRPFLPNKQPLLTNGFNASSSFLFNSSVNRKQGIHISYSLFKSYVENEKLINSFNLNVLSLGYILHYEYKGKLTGWYSDCIISVKTSGLSRNVNEEKHEYNDDKTYAYGIGGDLSVKLGYYLHLKKSTYLSPFIGIAYTPYLYAPNNEAIINQTKGLTSENWTWILSPQVGLSFHLKNE